MSQTNVISTVLVAASESAHRRARSRTLLGIYTELAKARLSALVVLTSAVGYVLAGQLSTPGAWAGFFWTLVGTALSAAGANALNQWIEVDRDARMERTRERPLPAGEISRGHAFGFGLATSIAGPLLLALNVTFLAALLAVACILIYVLAYTPLKPRTPLNTLVGAVCGAIPPMIGWAGASGTLIQPAFVLGAMLFLWQIPHSLALAWMYRDDYARGGFRMLPLIDASGWLTCQASVLYSLALLPVGLLLTIQNVCGWTFAIGSLLVGFVFVAAALQFHRQRDRASARRVFFASIVYLPVLMALMVTDRVV